MKVLQGLLGDCVSVPFEVLLDDGAQEFVGGMCGGKGGVRDININGTSHAPLRIVVISYGPLERCHTQCFYILQ